MSRSEQQVAAAVATGLLAGAWEPAAMRRSVVATLGLRRSVPWIGALVAETRAAYRDPPLDRPRELAGFVSATPAWQRRWSRRPTPRAVLWTPVPTAIIRRPWPIAELDDLGALARLLDVDQGELAWFADVRGWARHAPEPLRHYRWTLLTRADGKQRWIAAPKPRLKEIQRRLLRHVLAPIPTHGAAHGGVPTRSVRTALEPHAGSVVVIRMDLTAFYPSIPAARVWGLLRMAGLPAQVAHAMTGLVTTVAPRTVSSEPRLRTPHLPQGAPTSPQLANLVAYSLDRRLAGLASSFGAQYSRYVDDLTFSGGTSLRNTRSRFVELVGGIVRDEGFAVNEAKTVVLGDAGRQQLLGGVVNVHPAVPRRDRDALRATLHNCVVRGWESQARGRSAAEFRDHLLGQVAWVGSLRPEHGRKLRALADQIDWS